MDKPHNHSLIVCDECGAEATADNLNFTGKDLLTNDKETLMSVKTYFADAGWYTSWGYDVCPACREMKGL